MIPPAECPYPFIQLSDYWGRGLEGQARLCFGDQRGIFWEIAIWRPQRFKGDGFTHAKEAVMSGGLRSDRSPACFSGFLRAAVLVGALCASAGAGVLWEIGVADNDTQEFALGRAGHEGYSQRFAAGAMYVVGHSEAKKGFPYIQPGPADVWAGSAYACDPVCGEGAGERGL